jgi:ferritin-like metal-binding protein YciE
MTTKTQRGTDERKATETGKSENGSGRSKNKKTLVDLLETGLKDIYSAETQLVAALPEVAQAADNEELEEAINHHLEQTKKQVSRLEKIFERLDISKSEMEKCAAMEGLIEENKKIISEFPRSAVRDSALIIGAQKIEHYEIAAYGSLCELADVLGEDRICDLLEKSLDEEEETDEYLTEIAEEINDEASEISYESER